MGEHRNRALVESTRGYNRVHAFLYAGLTVVVGIVVVIAIFAAGTPIAFEAEVGQLGDGATIVSTTGASGGLAVQFGHVAATPTPTPSGSSSCPLPAYPDASCTGVPSGTVLTTVNGDLTVTTDNAVVNAENVIGCINIQAVGVVVKDSKMQCISTADSTRARDPANPRLTVEDSEVACPDVDGSTGIGDRNINVYRVNIHTCENGFDMDSDATIEDSFIHDLHQSVVAHTDGIQSAVGSNLILNHNTFYGETPGACGVPSGHTADCGGTSAININNSASGPHSSNTTISNNLLAGGAYTLYCPIPSTTNFNVINNHFSKIFYPDYGAFGPATDCDGETVSGNVDQDTGAPLSLN